MDDKFDLKDSGKREEFPTGAVRDIREGKGRFDLISPHFLRRLAVVMEKGAKKYGDRNWEKGMPAARFLDSALRHLNQYNAGLRDEDHLAQVAFNVMAIIHFEETGMPIGGNKPAINYTIVRDPRDQTGKAAGTT